MEPARSLLAPVARLERWLDVALVALLVACAVRYVLRHGLHAQGWLVIAGATVLALVALLRPRAGDGPVSVLRVVVLVLVWSALTLMAPSFAWAAVAVAFAVLRALPFLYAACVVALMALVVSVGSLRISDGFDPTLVVGPIAMAILTVAAFRALDREAADRQALLDDLRTAQDDLVVAERRAGGFAERARISREIHDSVGQGLSSINLLLQAAEQDWDRQPENARAHVGRAAQTPRAGLDEVRRVVRDLAPSELDGDTVEGLHEALGEIVREGVRVVGAGGRTLNEAHDLDLDLDLGACCDLDPDPARDVDPGRDLGPGRGSDRAAGLHGELRVHGTPTPLPREVGAAILRTTRGALANVVEHAGAKLFAGIRGAARGEAVLAPSVAATVIRRAAPGARDAVTEREVEVLELLSRGLGNKEMARELFVSEATVKSHLSHIYSKLGVDTRAGAVAAAIERRIIRT